MERDAVVTSLGTMLYDSPRSGPWAETDSADRETLVFLHGFGIAQTCPRPPVVIASSLVAALTIR